MIWAIRTCQTLLRGSFPRHKYRNYLDGVANIEILLLPVQDASRPSFGGLLGFLWASFWHLGTFYGDYFGYLGRSWGAIRSSWVALGGSEGALGALLGCSWELLGCSSVFLGRSSVLLGRSGGVFHRFE